MPHQHRHSIKRTKKRKHHSSTQQAAMAAVVAAAADDASESSWSKKSTSSLPLPVEHVHKHKSKRPGHTKKRQPAIALSAADSILPKRRRGRPRKDLAEQTAAVDEEENESTRSTSDNNIDGAGPREVSHPPSMLACLAACFGWQLVSGGFSEEGHVTFTLRHRQDAKIGVRVQMSPDTATGTDAADAPELVVNDVPMSLTEWMQHLHWLSSQLYGSPAIAVPMHPSKEEEEADADAPRSSLPLPPPLIDATAAAESLASPARESPPPLEKLEERAEAAVQRQAAKRARSPSPSPPSPTSSRSSFTSHSPSAVGVLVEAAESSTSSDTPFMTRIAAMEEEIAKGDTQEVAKAGETAGQQCAEEEIQRVLGVSSPEEPALKNAVVPHAFHNGAVTAPNTAAATITTVAKTEDTLTQMDTVSAPMPTSTSATARSAAETDERVKEEDSDDEILASLYQSYVAAIAAEAKGEGEQAEEQCVTVPVAASAIASATLAATAAPPRPHARRPPKTEMFIIPKMNASPMTVGLSRAQLPSTPATETAPSLDAVTPMPAPLQLSSRKPTVVEVTRTTAPSVKAGPVQTPASVPSPSVPLYASSKALFVFPYMRRTTFTSVSPPTSSATTGSSDDAGQGEVAVVSAGKLCDLGSMTYRSVAGGGSLPAAAAAPSSSREWLAHTHALSRTFEMTHTSVSPPLLAGGRSVTSETHDVAERSASAAAVLAVRAALRQRWLSRSQLWRSMEETLCMSVGSGQLRGDPLEAGVRALQEGEEELHLYSGLDSHGGPVAAVSNSESHPSSTTAAAVPSPPPGLPHPLPVSFPAIPPRPSLPVSGAAIAAAQERIHNAGFSPLKRQRKPRYTVDKTGIPPAERLHIDRTYDIRGSYLVAAPASEGNDEDATRSTAPTLPTLQLNFNEDLHYHIYKRFTSPEMRAAFEAKWTLSNDAEGVLPTKEVKDEEAASSVAEMVLSSSSLPVHALRHSRRRANRFGEDGGKEKDGDVQEAEAPPTSEASETDIDAVLRLRHGIRRIPMPDVESRYGE